VLSLLQVQARLGIGWGDLGMTGTTLVRYQQVRRAIRACVKVDEAKDIRDKAPRCGSHTRR
jgi:hypothetical protein